MSTLSTPPALLEAIQRSEETWQSDLHELLKYAKDRFPDILWEPDEHSEEKSQAEVWGHKGIVYARAPPSWQTKYSLSHTSTHHSGSQSDDAVSPKNNPDVDLANQSRSLSPFRSRSPSQSTNPFGLLRLPLTNPAIFPDELGYLYTARGLSPAFEFLFDQSPEPREGDEDETRLDKLRKDLVFMWRSRLYSDVTISLTDIFSSINYDWVFSSHRFMLVSRSPYFHASIKSWGKTANAIAKAAAGSEGERLKIILPSPPFTPASLHFTLGYIYTGTLVFSHRTYDLDTAFHIMKSATFLSIQSLYDEIQARIVQEMMHGLYHAFLEFSEYEHITGGKWGAGGCRCRQCARRAPRVLEFAIAEEVKNQHLERGSRRALVGTYGEGWCTLEFSKLSDKTKLQLVKGLAKRTSPINIFSLLFAAHYALKKLNNISELWSGNVKDLVLSARKTIDEVLSNQAEECFEQSEWLEIMSGDGLRSDDSDKVEWVMESLLRGLNEMNAPLVYQTLVSSILLRPHPTEGEQTMLSATSHIKVQTEQTRVEVVRWLRRRWVSVKQAGGFDKLDGWSVKELSHEIDVSIDELLNPEMPEHSPHKSMLINRRTAFEEPNSGSMHSVRTGAGKGRIAQLQGTPTKHERVHSSAASLRSAATSTLSATSGTTTHGTPWKKVLSPGSRPDSKLTPGSSFVPSPTRSMLSIDQNGRRAPIESRTARNHVSRSPAVNHPRPRVSALRKVSTPSNTNIVTNTPEHDHTDSVSRPQSPVSIASETSSTFETASSGSSSAGSNDSTARSTKRTRTDSVIPNTPTTNVRTTNTSLSIASPTTPSKSPIRARRASAASNLSVRTKRITATSSILDLPPPLLMNRQPAPASVSDIRRELNKLDHFNDEYRQLLLELLSHRDLKPHIHDLQEPDLRGFIELLDNALDHIQVTDDLFRKTLRRLQDTCSNRRVLPLSYLIPSRHLLNKGEPFAAGRFANVHAAELKGTKVCIKVLRSYSLDTSGVINKVFYEEVIVWKRLRHPNIVPFLGVPTETPPPFEIVCDWMENGRITEYVGKHPQVYRAGLLWDVVDGLRHLHSCEIIHGDLKGANILIDKDGRARLADFGLTLITRGDNSTRVVQGTDTTGMTTWAAPEILRGGAITKEGDVFTFAMVTIETFTGHAPFVTSYQAAMFDIMAGKRPGRPETLSHDGLWELVQTCWDQDPGERPTTFQLLESFQAFFPTLEDRRKAPAPAWRHLISCPLPTDKRIPLIKAIFYNRDEVNTVNHLSGDDAQTFVDVIDETMDMLVQQLQRNCLDTLRKICGRQGLLPRSMQIKISYDRSDTPLYQGGYADVWKGQYQGSHVAVKVSRVCSRDNFKKITSMFCKEVITWKTLHHPNILPLLGVMMCDRHFVMVSEWMEFGNINEFIKANQDANRFKLLKDISRGLIYMHNREMMHGDLKGANILIDQNGHACLADFGLITVISDPKYATAPSTKKNAGTVSHMSPELLHPQEYNLEGSQPTKESDYYALGMVIFEVLSGQHPFADDQWFVIMLKVTQGKHPERPGSPLFTDDLWKILEQCWSPQPKNRPTSQDVLNFLEQAQIG